MRHAILSVLFGTLIGSVGSSEQLQDDKSIQDKAIAELTEAIRLDPKNGNAYFDRARIWRERNEFDKAIADWTEVIRLNPKDVEAHLQRAFCWQQKGEQEKATSDLEEARRLADSKIKD